MEVIDIDYDDSLDADTIIPLDSDNELENVSIGDPEVQILSPSEWNDSFISKERIDRHFRQTGYGSLLCFSPQGESFAVGMCVELVDKDFVFIEKIIPSRTTSAPCRLRGVRLRRNSQLDHLHPQHDNEVSAFMQITDGNPNPSIYKSLITRTTAEVKAVRELIFTNAKFPEHQSLSSENDSRPRFRNEARLICRTKHIQYCTKLGRDARVTGGAVINLTEDDVESVNGRTVSDVVQNVDWTSTEVYDLTAEDHAASTFSRPRARGEGVRYSAGDICCGAGTAARAAHDLGAKISFGVDIDGTACKTFRLNFDSARTFHKELFAFLQGPKFEVDILLVSFPCQPYSHCHTRPGKNDDANSALFSAIGLLIEHCRPRIIIFEQTSGLYRIAQHKPVFESYIREITSTGYSARWTVLNAAHAGGVHARKRLHIIASCPGEPLPPFPEPTHGAPPLAPLMTIAKCLAMLPDDQPPHMRESRPRKGIPYDPHTVLRHCITTNGGQGDLHPCGSRSFSAQELAAMAGFPPWHRFPRTNLGRLRRLIGNAVVYEMHKAILQEVLRSMRMWDKRVLAWRPEGEPMVID